MLKKKEKTNWDNQMPDKKKYAFVILYYNNQYKYLFWFWVLGFIFKKKYLKNINYALTFNS